MLEQTAPTVFSFESTVNIRMVMIDQRPYFVAQDVCSALEIKVLMLLCAKSTAMKRVRIQYGPLVDTNL